MSTATSTNLSPIARDAIRNGRRRIIITGASGWLGRATLALLHDAMGPAAHERIACFGSADRRIELGDGLVFEQRPLSRLAALPPAPSLVFHLAFLTKDRAEETNEADYRVANERLSKTVVDALDAIGATGIFVASSGAAGYADSPAASAAMRLYGELKVADELRFSDWAEKTGRTAVIPRIFNLSGPYINKHSAYALASFIRDALARRPIEIQASRRVIRSYVAIRELISLAIALLADDATAVCRFDTGGDAIELGDVAREVAAQIGEVVIRRPVVSPENPDRYAGDRTMYDGLIRRHRIAAVDFCEQVAETIAFMKRMSLVSA
jgi:nucleoside-diphosphate-sugar epimerase